MGYPRDDRQISEAPALIYTCISLSWLARACSSNLSASTPALSVSTLRVAFGGDPLTAGVETRLAVVVPQTHQGGQIMLQTSEIQQRFSLVEQAIGQAAQACINEATAPPQLKECIQKLDRQLSLAKEVMRSQDPSRIRKCVEDLEQLGDEAKRVCKTEGQVTPRLKEAVFANCGLYCGERQDFRHPSALSAAASETVKLPPMLRQAERR